MILFSWENYVITLYDYFYFTLTENKLLEYEKVVAMAAEEGININTGERVVKWTYVQAVFFAATILTTIGMYWTI